MRFSKQRKPGRIVVVGGLIALLAGGSWLAMPRAGAAIALRGSAVKAVNTSATVGSLTFTGMPAGVQAGDVLVGIFSVYNSNATITMPSGWLNVTGTSETSVSNMTTEVYYTIAQGPMSGMTVTHTAQKSSGIIMAFSGVDTADPFGGYNIPPKVATTASTTLSTNGFASAVAANSVVVAAFGGYNTTSNTAITYSAGTGTSPTMTCAVTCHSGGTNVKNAPLPYSGIEYGTLSASSSVAARTMTSTQAMVHVGYVFVLKPYVPPTVVSMSNHTFMNVNADGTLGGVIVGGAAEGSEISLRQLLSVNGSTLAIRERTFQLYVAKKSNGVCGLYHPVSMSSSEITDAARTAVNDQGIGTLAWGTPAGVTVDTLEYATLNPTATINSWVESNYLVTGGYGFLIPSDATITGVSFDYLGVVGRGVPEGSEINAVISVALSDSAPMSPEKSTYLNVGTLGAGTFGGPGDTWDTTPLTPEIVNDASFGVAVRVRSNNTSDVMGARPAAVELDDFTMTIYYTEPASGRMLFATSSVPSDRTVISSNVNDPTTGRPVVLQSYVRSIGFKNDIAPIPDGSDGLWDFRLMPEVGSAGKTFCFKVWNMGGAELSGGPAEITILSNGPDLSERLRGGQAVREGKPETPLVQEGSNGGW